MAKFFYDNQIRRFLVQFARIFSDWQVTKGKDPAGNDILIRVPIMYGDSSRMAAAVLNNNSSSSLPSAPLITYYISGLEYDQKRTQDPYFIDKTSVRQRSYNTDTQSYEQTQGQAFTVERIMPVPYTLRISVEFWTTNYQQKLELIEQLGVLFNPSMELQSTDNFIDWTSLSVVYQDGLTFSSKTIPQGTGNPVDVMTWKFYMPIWISSAAKIKKLGVIHKIIASIFQGNALSDMQDDDLLLGTRQKITPYGYKLLLLGNSLQILPANQTTNPRNSDLSLPDSPDTDVYWKSVLNVYGTVKEGVSQIRLQNPYMETEIVGTISFNASDDRLLQFDIDTDTLPQDTLDPVDSIINPHTKGPNAGLPAVALRQRYLIVEDIDHAKTAGYNPATTYFVNNIVLYQGAYYKCIDDTIGQASPGIRNTDPSNTTYWEMYHGYDGGSKWGSLVANANDIIEYNGSVWTVAFDSKSTKTVEYVTNLTSSVQYRYDSGQWMKSYEGWYGQGDYSIVI